VALREELVFYGLRHWALFGETLCENGGTPRSNRETYANQNNPNLNPDLLQQS
jgi:hypothetical protein